ncbi:glycosyltransferase [Sulfitobacter sp. HNIBRBA3233]|uniref:glycosyltransferase n=1 Tax=Sulfitobacter marinivivus TaxID=3158558 RepID=UPI0032DFC712
MRRKIVMLTDVTFWEGSYGSHARIAQLLRSLSQAHEVVVFLLRTLTVVEREKISEIAGLSEVEIISYKSYSGHRPSFARKLSKLPYYAKRWVPDFAEAFNLYLEAHPADAVIFEYLTVGYIADVCPPETATILDMHDVMSSRTINMRMAGLRASIELDVPTERELLAGFDAVMAISSEDVDFCQNKLELEDVLYVPHAVAARSRNRFGDGSRMLFVGANSAPNVTGLRWFIDQVMPLLEERMVLHVVGDVCNAFVDRASSRIVLHGRQDDLDAHFDAADISVNPVFVGGGLKIKCVDALAAGLPCVTTVEGAAGLAGARGAGLAVATSRVDFARAVTHFAEREHDRRAVARAAPIFMGGEFSPQRAIAPLLSFLGTLETGSGDKAEKDV